MQFGKLVVDPGCKDMIFYRCTDTGNKRCDFRSYSTGFRKCNVFSTPADKRRRCRDGKEWILFDRHERVDRRRVEHCIVLVGREEEGPLASVIQRQPHRAAKGEAWIVLLKWQPREAKSLVSRRIGVENIIPEKVKTRPR